ncbi:FHA domain-containing protein [uncultured Clostridium sp.]|uniref:FHA domain-containing protein n=1 Tax=uncultured Clostridium sp. TaxID=59620 RepID=UPI0025846CC1|nr:FHA domain-containing protein [uncultured Clostridium sp.]
MKFKAKVKNSELTVKVKISSNEVISERELDILEKKNIRGLLKPKHRKRYIIDYFGPAGVSLIEHLKKPVTKYEFFFIMAQIVDAIKKVEDNNLFLNNLILDLRYVYINENTKEIQFIYIPVISNHIFLNVIGFMESIAYAVKLMPNQDVDFVAKYVSFIRSLNYFNISDIEAYISKEDKDIAKQIKKQSANVSAFIKDKPKDYYEPKIEYFNEETSILINDEETGLLNEYNETRFLDSYEDEFEENFHDNEGTMLLVENEGCNINLQQENVRFPYLERKCNGEIISINKPVFRLGKEKSYVDYFITNNNAVSRSHADIITRGKSYFVCDQNSTNHTYINDKVLVIKSETEIHDGDVLKLANEEFIFHI